MDLNLNLTLRNFFASAQSKQAFPGSSFTACVLDVKVGKVDICVGNFWVTAERLSLINFMQPFSEDKLYLVAANDVMPETFGDILYKPLKPFEPELWALVVVYMSFTAVITIFLDAHSEDYKNTKVVPRFFKVCDQFALFMGRPLRNPYCASFIEISDNLR